MSWAEGPPSGEARRDVAIRVLGWLSTLDPSPNTLIVAHGTLLGCLVGLLDGTPVETIGWSFMPNATLFTREVPPGQWASLLAAII
jgi:broad specificity phosphatase PhoE